MSTGVAICIPTRNSLVSLDWSVAMQTQMWEAGMHMIILREMTGTAAEAREKLVEDALKWGARYVWFVDDDTVPPRDAGLKLMQLLKYERARETKTRAVTGIYFTKQSPVQPLLFVDEGDGGYWDWKVGDIFPVNAAGAGCLMIRADVFKELPRPWFDDKQELSEGEGGASIHSAISEDIFFCERLKKAGFQLLAHAGVLCEHYRMPRLIEADADPYKWVKYALPERSPPNEPRPGGELRGADGKLYAPPKS